MTSNISYVTDKPCNIRI